MSRYVVRGSDHPTEKAIHRRLERAPAVPAKNEHVERAAERAGKAARPPLSRTALGACVVVRERRDEAPDRWRFVLFQRVGNRASDMSGPQPAASTPSCGFARYGHHLCERDKQFCFQERRTPFAHDGRIGFLELRRKQAAQGNGPWLQVASSTKHTWKQRSSKGHQNSTAW